MLRKSVALSVVSVIFLAVFGTIASANVSLKNGNFFMGYTDIIYPGGFEPRIERVYNSKSLFQGVFGPGWGNEFETYLNVSADGSVVMHEYGGGAENHFIPVGFKPAELDKAIDLIAGMAKKTGILSTNDQVAAYKKRLKTDATFRNDEWEKFRSQGKLQARQLPVNTQLYSTQYSYQYITRVAGGYIRSFDNGRIEKFNDNGKLSRVSDKNNNFIDLSYGKDGKLQKVIDNFNRKIFFTFGTNGKLAKIQGENGKEAVYKYNDLNELVYSKDVNGNIYTYKYSSDGRHDMVEIGYTDKTKMVISYYDAKERGNVKSVKDRDGTLTEYVYQRDAADKGHVSVAVAVKNAQGKGISSSKYEYFVKTKANGEEWTQKMITTLDGDRTETVYNEAFGLPVAIRHAGEETLFEYDVKGHVTKKVTPVEVTELAYDQKVGKISKVVRYSKMNKKQTSWSTFQYDDKGNLSFAKNSENHGVKLFYDNFGRIRSMVDQNKRRIDFKYNENSKPIEISDPSVGTITVSYNNSGEIKKVESTAGRKIALQVTSAFQNLLDIIRPAGVSLSF